MGLISTGIRIIINAMGTVLCTVKIAAKPTRRPKALQPP